jgi:4-amino-4-deoxy-L-arabinose transferase-like glycosyltransferase
MKTINLISLFALTGVLAVCALEKKEGRVHGGAGGEKQGYGFPFLFFLIYGLIAIRCIGLGEIPGGFNQDGAMGAVDALALARHGTDRFGTWLPAHFKGWGYGQMSVFLSYLTVPFIWLFGFDSLTVRLPMLVLSLAGACAAYGIAKRLISSGAAVCVLAFLAVNPWHFMQSRWALDCNAFPHLFLLGLYFLTQGAAGRPENESALTCKGLLSRGSRELYLSMVFFGLCMYAYGVSFYMVPFFLLAACVILLVRRRIVMVQAFVCALVYFGISFPIYGTMLINFMKWDTVSLPFTTMPYFADSVRSGDIVFFSEHPLKQLISNLNALIRVVFLQKPDLIWNAIDDFGTMYQCSMPVIFAGFGISVYQAVRNKDPDKRLSFLLLLVYWSCSVFTGLCINNVNVNRINIIFYSHILFAGIAVYYLAKEWRRAAAVVVLVYCLQSLLFFHQYFTSWAQRMEDMFYKDFLEATEYAGQARCDVYYITPDTPVYGASVQRNEILTMFALEIDAEYYRGETDSLHGKGISCGNEVPYQRRFRYKDPTAEEIYGESNAGFVVMDWQRSWFDEERFEVRRFGDYIVALPRR